jgi:uncharacterized membrane protein
MSLSSRIGETTTLACPKCGGENSHDAVFCANPHCGKALGEFRYVTELVRDADRWYEKGAARIASFVSHPVYIIIHVIWFAAWIAVNTGFVMLGRRFDDYPFSLLGIVIAIEAIFVTGFLLITQNRQSQHADKRAELDYEVNVRTYREILEIKRMLHDLAAEKAHPGRNEH